MGSFGTTCVAAMTPGALPMRSSNCAPPSRAEPSEACGAGLLTHASCGSVDEVARALRADHQTITYFGLSDAERGALAREAGRAGVDRVVPVGRALDFGTIWDGYALWSDLTRTVVVQ